MPRQRKRLYLRIDFERLRSIRPVQEVRIVTDTPEGVLRAVVILPSRQRIAVLHRLLRQTSTCRDHEHNEPGDCELCLDDELLVSRAIDNEKPTSVTYANVPTWITSVFPTIHELVCFSRHKVVCPSGLNVALAAVHATLICDSAAEDFWSSRQCPGEIPSHW